ncbi:hypothetical protein TSOC_011843 [Tetrabaena socialis]|uniref:Uncharacterized protein n=1 Tax=Tetrabaena socialis TaxID=47790 RepID=A0A2J7ZPK2_9CHLO|nr:hypothetical protein TSOC_011843 [Tetrabaena socialis]|eukprot:PNH02204.1 hypothetical protein TSOC_011843 [Tetrabaena socialis]
MADLDEFSKTLFDEAYKRALERKRLFKEYLARHQVMEKLNGAIEKLYECERLPENPLDFIAEASTGRAYMTQQNSQQQGASQQAQQPAGKPKSAGPKAAGP